MLDYWIKPANITFLFQWFCPFSDMRITFGSSIFANRANLALPFDITTKYTLRMSNLKVLRRFQLLSKNRFIKKPIEFQKDIFCRLCSQWLFQSDLLVKDKGHGLWDGEKIYWFLGKGSIRQFYHFFNINFVIISTDYNYFTWIAITNGSLSASNSFPTSPPTHISNNSVSSPN